MLHIPPRKRQRTSIFRENRAMGSLKSRYTEPTMRKSSLIGINNYLDESSVVVTNAANTAMIKTQNHRKSSISKERICHINQVKQPSLSPVTPATQPTLNPIHTDTVPSLLLIPQDKNVQYAMDQERHLNVDQHNDQNEDEDVDILPKDRVSLLDILSNMKQLKL